MVQRGLLPLAFALCGCGDNGGAAKVPLVPPQVQQMMDAQFPADGQIHIQSKGRIRIKPETSVCEIWPAVSESKRADYFGIKSDDLSSFML